MKRKQWLIYFIYIYEFTKWEEKGIYFSALFRAHKFIDMGLTINYLI